MSSNAKLTRPIFVLGFNKSGTSLLKSLFDDHSGLFALPAETHFFQWAGQWVDFPLKRADHLADTIAEARSQLRERFARQQAIIARQHDESTGGAAGFAGYPVEAFERAFRADSPTDFRQLFCSYMNALYAALEGDDLPDDVRIVEKSVEHAEFAPILKTWFPDAHFVHIVRNPYATVRSMRSHIAADGEYIYCSAVFSSMERSYGALLKNQNLLDDYHVVKYEDLVSAPESVMRALCESVELDFEDTLLTPSVLGQSWGGNSTSGDSFDGISADRLEAWKGEVEPLEIRLINRLLGEVMERFDYSIEDVGAEYMLPAEDETLKQWVMNRAFLFSYF